MPRAGALVREDGDGVLRIYGIVSRGHPLCDKPLPGIYTDMSDHYEWLTSPRTHIPQELRPSSAGAPRIGMCVAATAAALML